MRTIMTHKSSEGSPFSRLVADRQEQTDTFDLQDQELTGEAVVVKQSRSPVRVIQIKRKKLSTKAPIPCRH